MRLFKIALPCLFVAGLALLFIHVWNDRGDRDARALALEHAREQFAERAALVRAAPDAERYHAELRALLRGWFAEQSALGNRWPLLRGEALPFVPPAPRAKSGALSEWQDLVDASVGAWREGRLELFQSAAAEGLRLDLLRVRRTAGAQPHLGVDVAVWGAPGQLEAEETPGGKNSQRASVALAFQGLSLRFFDAKGTLIAAMPGEGEPSLRLDLPERLAQDAPPGLVLGRFEPGLFPREAAEAEWTLAVQLRTPAGESRVARATFRARVEPLWKVAPGESWGGAERIRADADEPSTAKPPARAARADKDKNVWPARADNL